MAGHFHYAASMRAKPQRIRIEGGGAEGGADVDPAAMPAALTWLFDELRAPAPPGAAEPAAGTYDVVLDYGDRSERLRYAADELPDEVRAALDSVLRRGA